MIRCLFSLALLLLTFEGYNQNIVNKDWTLELQGGMAFNFKTPLTVKQEGFEEARIPKAEFESQSLTFPLYFSFRLSRWINANGLSFELIHHKIYLQNTTNVIQSFSISHGFNMLLVNYGRKVNSFNLRGGLGTLLAHPESIIRGEEDYYEKGFDAEGYTLGGIILHLSASRPFRISDRFYLNTEFKLTGAFASVPVVKGEADINLITFHVTIGPGFQF